MDPTKSCAVAYNNLGGKEAIPFTVKGPIAVQLPESHGDRMGRTGCSILELTFQSPCQIGELVFCNYYVAWMSIYVKRMSNKIKTSHPGKEKETISSTNYRARPTLHRSFSIDVPTAGGPNQGASRPWSPLQPLTLSLSPSSSFDGQILHKKSTAGGCSSPGLDEDDDNNFDPLEMDGGVLSTRNLQQMSQFSKRHPIPSISLSSSDLPTATQSLDSPSKPWELSIEMKSLMPWPHFEHGSQDLISIPATESLVEWRDVSVMRIVLHQPSTVWKKFTIDELNVFRHLPKRGFTYSDDVMRQRDNWFSVLKMNTKAMLSGQLVEPDNDDGMTT